jgi:hypothetical protein
VVLKKNYKDIFYFCKIKLIYVFNKINQELYVIINDKIFLDPNHRLNEKNMTKMHIRIYNLISHVTFQLFYLIIE